MKYNMKSAMSVTIKDLIHMKEFEKAELAQYFQTMYQRRKRESNKAGIIPYGMAKLDKDFEIFHKEYGLNLSDRIISGKKNPSFSKAWSDVPYRNNVLTAYVSKMQDFFSWKSSTIAGWNSIKANESSALFGFHYEKVNGRRKRTPNYMLSEDERKKFWEVYHELLKRESNNLLPSDSAIRTNYAGIKSSGLAKYWAEYTANHDIVNTDKVTLIEVMEASMNAGKFTIPDDVPEHEVPEGYNDPFTGIGGDGDDIFGENVF